MGAGAIFGGIVLLAIILGIGYFIGVYNKLVTMRERHKNAFSQIEIQLKRRYDLIPNLVEIAKGYLKHEKETLTAVIEARNTALGGLKAAAAGPGDPSAMAKLASAEAGLAGAMGRLNMVIEQYPDLKANENMAQLTEELTSTENKVTFARQAFNDAVTAYNTYKKQFPPVIVAGMAGHGNDASLLEFEDSAQIQAAPKVSF
jgi:LemA protein